jgi:hypothetical protein
MSFWRIFGKIPWFDGLPERNRTNPEKVSIVLGIQFPRNTKQLQGLIGCITALNRFISRSTGKCLPFFKILRKAFEWDGIRECLGTAEAMLVKSSNYQLNNKK